METIYKKEQILKAFKEGKTIQSKDGDEWVDFIPQNQVDKPNLDYRGIDNWRIKGETIKSDNTQTLENALKQIEKLEADRKEFLMLLNDCKIVIDMTRQTHGFIGASEQLYNEIESLFQKHKQ